MFDLLTYRLELHKTYYLLMFDKKAICKGQKLKKFYVSFSYAYDSNFFCQSEPTKMHRRRNKITFHFTSRYNDDVIDREIRVIRCVIK